MYLEHYGLDEPPYSITPDPRFVYLSERHRDALAHLLFGIGQGGGGGFVQLTGEVGTGKTTLCQALAGQLQAQGHSVGVVPEYLRQWCEARGIAGAAASPRPAPAPGAPSPPLARPSPAFAPALAAVTFDVATERGCSGLSAKIFSSAFLLLLIQKPL